MESGINKIFYDLETSLLKPEVRGSYEKLNELIADDFIEFGSSGSVCNKNNILERLPKTNEKIEYIVSDFIAKELTKDIVLTTFKTEKIIDQKSKPTSLRSSLWRNNNGQWQIFFHQGTLLTKNS